MRGRRVESQARGRGVEGKYTHTRHRRGGAGRRANTHTRVTGAGAQGGGQIPNEALNWSMAISQFLIWDDVSEISLKEGQSEHGGE